MTDIMTRSPAPGWTVYRLGQLFKERRAKVSDKDFPPLSVTMNGIVPQLDSAAKTDDGDNRKLVRVGDYVINSRSDRKGSGGISRHDGSVSLISIVLEPTRIDPAFAHHLLRSTAFQEEFYRWGHGIVADLWTTRYSDMKNIRLYLPDLTTQRQVADFLDRETARIDLLIEKKQRMVELLGIKLDSEIHQVLCINTNPAGMESLRWLVRVGSGDFLSNEDISKEEAPERHVPVIGGNGIMGYTSKPNSPPNTLVVGRVGALCGNVHLVTGPSWVTDNALVVRLISDRLLPDFANHFLKASKLNQHANRNAQPLITGEMVKRTKIRIPALPEQRSICDLICLILQKAHTLVERTELSIARLREYRSALITAAVTGQIAPATHARAGSTDRQLDALQAEGGNMTPPAPHAPATRGTAR